MEHAHQETPAILEVALEPKSRHDQEKLEPALIDLAAGNPAISYTTDRESGQVILRSSDAFLLRPVIRTLRRDHGVEMYVGRPQVAYRETISRKVRFSYTHEQRHQLPHQLATLTIDFSPEPAGRGFSFVNHLPDGSLFQDDAALVEAELKVASRTGVVAGFPLIDFRAELIDGQRHAPIVDETAVRIAVTACYRQAMPKAGPILLEPIMKVGVTVAAAIEADIVTFLEGRRGYVDEIVSDGARAIIRASVPLANLMDYVAGKGRTDWPSFSLAMNFDRYAPVPHDTDNDGRFRSAMALREGAWLA